ncbi:MAG: RagB/SusD family nutrient uptake outer membrane protein [Bacteroidota bacterium]|nr:RagB/SusD family nutrient uptake outer membrane protein [Bacteroidota bacterium]
MKTTKYIILFFIAIGLFLPSCKKDYLEITNPNLQTAATYWKTEDQALLGVNGVYQALLYDGTFLRFAPACLDSRDDITKSPSPWDAFSAVAQFNLLTTNYMPEAMYVGFYDIIKRANLAIANIPNITFKDENYKNRLIGEALYLRGMTYFYIVTFWNHVPLITNPPKSSADFFNSQVDASVVWNQVISDLTKAASYLPASYDASNKGRATKGAALGYLGKAYLFNKNYTKAAEIFKQIIDLGVYSLMPNYGDNFTEDYENNAESIFEVQFQRMNQPDLGWVGEPSKSWDKTTARAITYAPSPFGWGDMALNRWIFDEFKLEKTKTGTYDPRLYATITFDYPGCTLYGKTFRQAWPYVGADTAKWSNMFFCRKYENVNSGRPNEFDWRSGINERLMRYSDILLMYAESEMQLGQIASAAHYIQMVRNRANLPDREAEFAAYSKDQLFNQLVHERALEFCLEGHRFDDIVRWGWITDASKLAMLKSHDAEWNAYVPGKEYMPIPQIEMDTNPNAVQNPTY